MEVDMCAMLLPRVKRRRGTFGTQPLLGGGLTVPAEIPVADESKKKDDHERREKKAIAAAGKEERQGEKQ